MSRSGSVTGGSRAAGLALALALAAASGCGGAGPEPPGPPTPPWAGAPLDDAPAVYLREWSRAENRATCAPLAFSGEAVAADAVPRAATFGGGWGVAYDVPGLRSAFGVAGAGVVPGPDTYDDWPHRIRWADGSVAGYGPEGGSGPKQLAYLRVAGQSCLYNVWSSISLAHLEELLADLRFVAVPAP